MYRSPLFLLHLQQHDVIYRLSSCRPGPQRPPVEGAGAAGSGGITSGCVRGSQGESWLQTSSSSNQDAHQYERKPSHFSKRYDLFITACVSHLTSHHVVVRSGRLFTLMSTRERAAARSRIRIRHVYSLSRIIHVESSAFILIYAVFFIIVLREV